MSFGASPKRFASVAACFLLLSATPCLADAPPLGYVGPAPSTPPTAPPSSAMPPIGYVGPAPASSSAPDSQTPSVPQTQLMPSAFALHTAEQKNASGPPLMPVGYVGPIPHATPAPSAPASGSHVGETLISAQQMHSDSTTGIMTATGKVELVRGGYVLHADKVTYNQKTGVMTADGHVAVLMPTGEVEFAEHQEVTGDMKQAFAENAGFLFPDNSRMAALVSQRYEGRYTVANQASYTACNVCRQNPDQPPLWEMHAETITHDNEEHEIYYHNATIDIAGVPVAYTPYMSGPDPTVKRLQGFLDPSAGYSTYIGTYAKTPYYFDIAPDKDMVLTPTFSTTDKLQLATEYRERFADGNLNFLGSITRADLVDDSGVDKGEKMRGDAFSTFVYDIDSNWRAGTNIQYASDKSYLQRYQISSLDQTTSRAYLEDFNGRDYAAVNSYYFQDLRPGTDVSEPIVLPSTTVSMLGDPGAAWGGRWSFDGNTLITTRDNTGQNVAQQGPDTRRLSLNGGWQRQMISDTGLETTVSGLVRTDSYLANNVVAADNSTVYGEADFTRQFEQANAVMRYPMGRSGDGYQQLLEPIASFTAAPDVRVIAKQPNEDSQDVEFDETNLFSPNRFTGSDLIEGGSRATYGLRNAITTDSGSRIDIFGGESYDFSSNSGFPALSGLNNHFSDYVGRIDFSPVSWFSANYGFRLSEEDFSPQRQDAFVSTGVPIFRPWARYIQAYQNVVTYDGQPIIDNDIIVPENAVTTNQVEQTRQITIGFSSTFAKYWVLSGNHVQSFDPDPGPRSDGLTLNYVDECLGFGVNINRDDTDRADLSSGTSVSFHLFLKNLGGIHTDSVGGVNFPTEFRQTDQ